jgi:hypothetical protein
VIQDDDEGQALSYSQSHVTRAPNVFTFAPLLSTAIGSGCVLMPAAALSVTVYSYDGGGL